MLVIVVVVVIMVVVVVVVVVMIIVTVIMMIMLVMIMAVMCMVGAVQRAERGGDLGNGGAEALEHRLDHVVAFEENTVLVELGGKMAVAEVVGKLDLVHAVARLHFQQRFVGGHDFDIAGIAFEHQEIAMLQHGRLPEVEHDDIVMGHVQEFPADMPLVMGEHDNADRRGADMRAGLGDFGGAEGHGLASICWTRIGN
jgi:hypothetical protein